MESGGGHSETLFFVVGIALAAWALLVSALGVKLESFPSNRGGAIAVALISVALVASTIFVAIYVSL